MSFYYFQIRDLEKRHNVAVFSSNFNLYGDMSRRVISTLRRMVPAAEIYSIDEAFLDLRGIETEMCIRDSDKAQYIMEAGIITTESKVVSPIVECRAPYKLSLIHI